ncbi:hypothetical protein INT43_002389 [Umbelopsis isabellina]|uniref:G10 protein n=1 Tax=Mortierella isabellina TaxID=91625 RepID=A0A8H7Q522_MORIS|nr:hypothetical protein INT43_002389 [Umbelopsis isabellina]
MPKIRTQRTKRPPEGFDDIEPTLREFDKKMRDVENESHEGKRKVESLWPVFRIHHQRSRYVYDLYYKRKAISRELYDYLLKNSYADANLIAKWKKVNIKICILVLVLKECAACDAYNQKIQTLVPPAYAEYPRRNLKKAKSLSVFTVGAEDVQVEIRLPNISSRQGSTGTGSIQ